MAIYNIVFWRLRGKSFFERFWFRSSWRFVNKSSFLSLTFNIQLHKHNLVRDSIKHTVSVMWKQSKLNWGAVTCRDVAENLSVLSNETRNALIMWPKKTKQLTRFYSNRSVVNVVEDNYISLLQPINIQDILQWF